MHVLASRPVHELQQYEQYSAEHGLPLWRIELQLARMAMLLDAQRLAPGTPLNLSDYLVRPQQPAAPTAAPPDDPPTEAHAQAAADALGFRPMNRRKPTAPPTLQDTGPTP